MDVDIFNPFKWVKPDEYVNFWYWILNNVLQGFWAKLFAVIFFVLAMYVGVRRQNYRQAFFFYLLSFLFAYGGGIVLFLKRVIFAIKIL